MNVSKLNSSYHIQTFSISHLSLGRTATEETIQNQAQHLVKRLKPQVSKRIPYWDNKVPSKNQTPTDFTLNTSHLCWGHPTRAYVAKLRSVARFPEASCARNLGTRCYSLIMVWPPVAWPLGILKGSPYEREWTILGNILNNTTLLHPHSPMQKPSLRICPHLARFNESPP